MNTTDKSIRDDNGILQAMAVHINIVQTNIYRVLSKYKELGTQEYININYFIGDMTKPELLMWRNSDQQELEDLVLQHLDAFEI